MGKSGKKLYGKRRRNALADQNLAMCFQPTNDGFIIVPPGVKYDSTLDYRKSYFGDFAHEAVLLIAAEVLGCHASRGCKTRREHKDSEGKRSIILYGKGNISAVSLKYDGKLAKDHNYTHDEIESNNDRIQVVHLEQAREITSIYPGDPIKHTNRKVKYATKKDAVMHAYKCAIVVHSNGTVWAVTITEGGLAKWARVFGTHINDRTIETGFSALQTCHRWNGKTAEQGGYSIAAGLRRARNPGDDNRNDFKKDFAEDGTHPGLRIFPYVYNKALHRAAKCAKQHPDLFANASIQPPVTLLLEEIDSAFSTLFGEMYNKSVQVHGNVKQCAVLADKLNHPRNVIRNSRYVHVNMSVSSSLHGVVQICAHTDPHTSPAHCASVPLAWFATGARPPRAQFGYPNEGRFGIYVDIRGHTYTLMNPFLMHGSSSWDIYYNGNGKVFGCELSVPDAIVV